MTEETRIKAINDLNLYIWSLKGKCDGIADINKSLIMQYCRFAILADEISANLASNIDDFDFEQTENETKKYEKFNKIVCVLYKVLKFDQIKTELAVYDETESKRKTDARNVRYRDWGLLRYLLRGIEEFAPWAGNIYIVTAGQTPDFIDFDNPRIKLVFHSDFMPAEYLPTFSSRSIEFNLHKIQGLSEQFVYFNDDTLLTAPTKEEDFFKNGLPCDMHIQNVIAPVTGPMPQVQMNDMRIVNKTCSKREFMKNNKKKWLTLKYGKNVMRNLLLKKWDYYTGFYDPHLPLSLTKKMLNDIWKTEFRAVNDTCMRKFKSTDDINIWLCRYLYLAKGEFMPRKASFGRYTELSENNSAIYSAIRQQKQKVICVNDTDRCVDFELHKNMLCSAFCDILPKRSSFEKEV